MTVRSGMSLLCLTVLLTSLLPGSLADLCQFPTFLTAAGHWETKVTLARKQISTYIQFYGRNMEEVTYTRTRELQVNRECLQKFEDNKYLFKRVEDDVELFQCIQIQVHTPYVLQLLKSEEVEVESHALCEDDQLTPDPWLVVSPVDAEHQQDGCGLLGGYDFYLHDTEKRLDLCDSDMLQPKLEVQCGQESEGLQLDFRSFSCRGQLEMHLQQKLLCLGAWQEGDYTFSLLTDGGEFWPKAWLLRLPTTRAPGETFEAFLSPELVVDVTPPYSSVGTTHRLMLTSTDYPSVCEDEAKVCDGCGAFEGLYCQKSCMDCGGQTNCDFPEDTRGEWLQSGYMETKAVVITNSILYADDSEPMHCHGDASTDSTKQKRALVSIYNNGCRPQYSCLDVETQGPSVLRYRLAQHQTWPVKINLTLADLCSPYVFSPPDTLENINHLQILVRQVPQSSSRPSVTCDLRGAFHFTASMYGMPRSQCSGTLQACDFQDAFQMRHTDGCGAAPMENYRCIASFPDGASQILVTEKDGDPDSLHCWVSHRFDGDLATMLYKMPASDCNEAAPFDIRYHNSTVYLSAYRVMANSGTLLDQDTCVEPTTPRQQPVSRPDPTGARVYDWPTSDSASTSGDRVLDEHGDSAGRPVSAAVTVLVAVILTAFWA